MALVHRHVAPPDDPLALGLDRLLDQLLERSAALALGGQEAHADRVAARRRELDSGRGRPEEPVRDLDEDAGAVARVGIGALGSAVLEVLERGQALFDHGMAGLTP